MKAPKTLIKQYVNSYNQFDVDGMIENLHEDIIFENISNGEVSHRTEGREAFQAQAQAALSYFSTRKQTITNWQINGGQVEIEIQYEATLAMDFPNGMKVGDQLNLTGKSTFDLQEGKIVKITDES